MAYVALQLAYHLGFEDVLLVGVDLDQSVGRFTRTARAFFAVRARPALGQPHPAVVEADGQEVVSEHFHVYNLSATSRIPVELIPKVTLSQARHIAGCAMN